MFQTVIAVLIGMSFLYFILAVLCSGAKEFIAAKFNLRAATLEQAIGRMLSNGAPSSSTAAKPATASPAGAAGVENLATDFFSHPLVQDLGDENKKPSYIPAQYFSTVLEQILRTKQAASNDYAALIRNLPAGPLKEKLSALADRAGNEAEAIRKEIENWFDKTMDRVSGWYKRKAQKILLGIAFALVVALNADSFVMFRALWQNSFLRDSVVAAAGKAKTDITSEQAKQQLSDLEQLRQLPLGWPSGFSWTKVKQAFTTDFSWWLLKLLGLAITAFATMLGAPFWFDTMNKLLNIRSNGSPPQPAPLQPASASTGTGRSFAANA